MMQNDDQHDKHFFFDFIFSTINQVSDQRSKINTKISFPYVSKRDSNQLMKLGVNKQFIVNLAV